MSRKLWPFAGLALVALIAAGCGGSDSSSDGNTTAANQEKAVRFAECMRENGVSQFPDPDASGKLTIDGVLNGSSIDPDGPEWQRAIDACKDLQPPGFTGDEVTDDEQDGRLQFAQCIRDNGVPDFPDPTPDTPLVDTNRIPSSNTPRGMSLLNAAMDKCGSYAEELGIGGQ